MLLLITSKNSSSDFINLNAVTKDILKSKTKDSDENKVNWLKVKCFRFEKMSTEVSI